MAKAIQCECGFVARGESAEAVVATFEAHIRADHPDLVGTVTRQDVLGRIEELADPGGPSMSATTAAPFDAAAYKATTREQWQQAAEPWHRWGATLDAWLGEATETMLDLAGVTHGARVLDVAAGAGGQTLAAARRVGPQGAVLATDISPGILDYAQQEARAAGLTNVAVRVLDAEALDLEPGSFDAAVCRLGLMYLPALASALAGVRRALRPGGRLAAIVFSTPDRNGFFSVPVGIIRRRAGLGAPVAGQPGPFSLGAPGVLAGALTAAGFEAVDVRAVDAPLRLPAAADCLRLEQESFGALHQMLSGLDDAGRAAAWDEVGTALAGFEDADGFAGPCELLVVGASAA
jgi:SAM-dependent methyltransferase/predicted small metal-binding protein